MIGLLDRWYGVTVGPVSLRDQSREVGGYVEPITTPSGKFDVTYVFWLQWCKQDTQEAPKTDPIPNLDNRRKSLMNCSTWIDHLRNYENAS